MTSVAFPTEVIDLPSKGIFYPEGHPLRSGQVEIKYMTAKEEDILTSANLIKKGIVLDKLIDAIVVTKGITHEDFLLGDLNAVMIACRILAYGKTYPVTVVCPSCKNKVDYNVDLSNLDTTEPPSDDNFTFTLPSTGRAIKVRLLTRKIEKEIQIELDNLKKMRADIDPEQSTRLRYLIASVDGSTDAKTIRETSENMLVGDARELRKFYTSVSPDVKFESPFDCSSCKHSGKIPIALGLNFFWPDARI